MPTHYDATGMTENRPQPGSRGRVLENLQGIVSRREMDRIETLLLFETYQQWIDKVSPQHRFSSADLRDMHRDWLGTVYSWAGCYRQVNLSKGNFTFAVAAVVPKLMDELETDFLKRFTPCNFSSMNEVVHALAAVHAEFILVHPFREGNGRLGRLLAVLMALQAGLPPLDFGGIRGAARQRYFAAVRAAMRRDYTLMERVFSNVIRRTLRGGGESGWHGSF
jgi:cell filamentation protein